jgi:hypothetical protein
MFNKLKVYIHVAKMYTWEALLHEILEDIRFSSLGNKSEVTMVSVGGGIPDIKGKRVINTGLPLVSYEFPTLELLYDELEPNTAVCYCHLKGVSQPDSPDHRNWRRELSYFTILDWVNRISHLHYRWTSGPRIVNGGSGWSGDYVHAYKHYSGNFWWARSDYLTQLQHPNTFKYSRYCAESWLGQSPLINEEI